MRERLNIPLPPALQKVVDEQWPIWQTRAKQTISSTIALLGPLWHDIKPQIKSLLAMLQPAGTTSTLSKQFRHICIVGLNKAELLMQGESQSLMNENWLDLADDTLKKHLCLVFFAPRGLDGQPINPSQFLLGEAIDESTLSTSLSPALAGLALLDFCRLSPAAPNTLNILLAADVLFHWDNKDTYVLPTSPTSWSRDIEMVMQSYPRTTRVHIFTQWDTTILTPSERVQVHPLTELPLESNTWLNEPTYQEKFGTHVLVAGLVVAALTWVGLWYQSAHLQAMTDQLNIVQQQIPRGGQFGDLDRALKEQEDMFARRPLFYLSVKDAARAVTNSGIKIDQLEVKAPDSNVVPNNYLVTLTAQPEAYAGWLQQEPVARNFLLHSALISAVRKPPSSTGFKLEGLVNLPPLLKEYKRVANQLPSTVAPTLSVSATAATEKSPAGSGEQP
jgi:hypothetical protein